MDTEAKVKQIIAETLNFNGDVPMDSSIRDDLGADSLDEVEIVILVEDYFVIEIQDEDFDKVKTVQDAVDLVKRMTN